MNLKNKTMKTGNKILGIFAGVTLLFLLADLFVCISRYKRTQPRMQAFCNRLDTAGIRFLRYENAGGGVWSTTACVHAPGKGRWVNIGPWPDRLRISGDTLTVPCSFRKRLYAYDGDALEDVIIPDGGRRSSGE